MHSSAGLSSSSCLAAAVAFAISASASLAQSPLTGLVSERSLVDSGGVTYSVIDLYLQFTEENVNVVNVYNAAIANQGGAAFHHSDTSTFSGDPGAWSPTATIAFGDIDPAVDSFVLVGGAPGGSSTTALDPNFSPSSGPTIPANAGWYNSNPGNFAGYSDAGGRTWIARFATVATEAGETLSVTIQATFGFGGQAYQPTITATVDYLPADCTLLAATPASSSFAAAGTESPIAVTVTTGGAACSWSASTDDAWITLIGGAGSGASGSFTFEVAANATTQSRSGTVTVTGPNVTTPETFSVTQSGIACEVSGFSPASASIAAAGGGGSVEISTNGSNCSWTATSSAGWLTITSGATGTGTGGTIAYSAAANASFSSRSATITADGQTFTVTQAAAEFDCGFAATPLQREVSFIGSLYGAQFSLEIAADESCEWTAAPAAGSGWLTIVSGASGTGSGTVTYSVAANFFLPTRTGTIEVSRNGSVVATHTVVQAQPAPECTGAVEFASAGTTIAAAAGTHSVLVTTGGATCAWYATSDSDWLVVQNGGSFTGNGPVTFTVSANASPTARTGTISIGSGANLRTYAVTQSGLCAGLAVSPAERLVPFLGSLYGDAFGFSIDDGGTGCSWTLAVDAGSPPWVTVTSGASGSGSAAVVYTAEVNLFAAERTATISVLVGGTVVATHSIRQAGPAIECQDPVVFTPSSMAVAAAGESFDVAVSTSGATCAWYAEADEPWITIANGDSFTGDASISVVVAENSGESSRSGSITIGSGAALATFAISQAGTGGETCDVLAASAASTSVGAGGTSAPVAVSVTTGGESCSWSASSDAAWLTLTGASGTGASGSFTYTASENLSTSSRSATITVFSGTASPVLIAVTQQGYSDCGTPPTVTPATREVAAAAGSNSAVVSTPSGTCAWTATVTSGGEWLSIDSGGSGLGSGTIAYSFTENATASSRTGVITVTGGATHTITQPGSGSVCDTLTAEAAIPGSTTVPAAGTGSAVAIAVTTGGADCAWSASSDQAWLELQDADGTDASGTFTFTASENLSTSSRTGTITVSSGTATPVTVTVTQQGYSNCASAETVDPSTASVTADAGSGTVAITTPSGACAWEATVTSGSEWLSITSGGSGIGAGTIAYAHAENTGSERVGVITLTGGGTFTLTQAGAGVPCEPWTPAELVNMPVWLDAADTSFSNNDGVGAWLNKGTSDDASQSAANKRPTFKANLLNGKPGIQFDGVNDCLQIPSLGLDTNISVFVVAKSTTAKPFFVEHSSNAYLNDGFWFYGKGGAGSVPYRIHRGSNQNAFTGPTNWMGAAAMQACLTIDSIASQPNPMGTVYKDGVVQSDGTPVSADSVPDLSVTNTLNIGARDNGAAVAMDGDVYELILVNDVASQAVRQRVEGYLAWKWGLEANLPADHPYRAAPPTVGDCVPASPLVVEPDATDLPAPGVIQPVHVTVEASSGAAWSAASSEPWLAIADDASGSPNAFGFTAAPNLGMLPRTAVVTVTSEDGATASFEVRQQAPCEHAGTGDCNGDGISDLCAIAWGLASDRNGNGIPDACEAGTTVTVPGDFGTLQAALDASVDGWTIQFESGTYAGPIVIAERSVTLEAAGPLGSVIFDGTGHAGPVVTIVDDPSRGSLLPTTLRGIVVTGGSEGTPVDHDGATYSAGGGLLAIGAAVSIESCLITANHAGHGGGIAAVSASLSIAASEIVGNAGDHAGGGIALIGSESLIDGTTIHGNAASHGAGLWIDAMSEAQVFSSTICDNEPDQIAGAWQDLGGNAPCTCIGDLNSDGTVDGTDLAALLAAWGQSNSPQDLDGDGVVEGSDLATMLASWGYCP